jgi:hypothetical protein
MRGLKVEAVRSYLSSLFKKPVEIISIGNLAKDGLKDELKGYGYGSPLLIEFEIGGNRRRAVIETVRPGAFGHEHFSDRAQLMLWSHSTFNKLPRHVRSIDVGAFVESGRLVTLGDAEEFFILADFADGEGYYKDLERVGADGTLESLDLQRARALADYLVDIHKLKNNAPELYVRRIRDLLGHGEGIMGLMDSYPPKAAYIDSKGLEEIEHKCIVWRWKIKDIGHRLCQVHGDFHPWNILFRKGTDFTVLDRSRGEWGEPADDVSAMAINFIFLSLRRYGALRGPFERLFLEFFESYLRKTHDLEMLRVIQPFFAWRGLVVANPTWYPDLKLQVRRRVFRFIRNVLDADVFEIEKVNAYLGVKV